MKKVLFFVAVAAFVFLSCERHELETPKSFTFKASIEDFGTKANINESNALVWATGDKIGIYVNDDSWEDKNQPFTLNSKGGSTTGEFVWDYTGDFSTKAAAAFFPWQGSGSDKNNVYEGTMYFKLPESYNNYTSGQMLTPLIASLNNSSSPILFKHAGAAVKVTVSNLPDYAHAAELTVDGHQITGGFHINPAEAGSATLSLDNNPENPDKNSVKLIFKDGETTVPSTFIFPVPTLTTPKLSFSIIDKNGVTIWSKSTPSQQPSLARKSVLAMPAIDNSTITPYKKFENNISEKWTFCGSRTNWNSDISMYTDGRHCILYLDLSENEEFKIRADGKWNESYPQRNWVVTSEYAGKKVIIFDTINGTISVVGTDCPYPIYPPEL